MHISSGQLHPALAQFLARQMFERYDFEARADIRVLDPACGAGELLRAVIEAIPARHLERLQLLGIDRNRQALETARQRLRAAPVKKLELIHGDFLDICLAEAGPLSPGGDGPDSGAVHAIIANPPYVRTQVLGARRAQALADRFRLSGRIDLYQAFLVGMAGVLRPGGILGVITSNRFLLIRAGQATRKLLRAAFQITQLFDLGDTRLFEAAVLPAIVIGVRQAAGAEADRRGRFVRIYQSDRPDRSPEARSLFDLLAAPRTGRFRVAGRCFNLATGSLRLPGSEVEPWRLLTGPERAWVQRLEARAKFRFGDLVKVRVGIKTSADNVFIRDDWELLPAPIRPEPALLRPLLTRESALHWSTGQIHKRVLYPHYDDNGRRRAIDLKDYPKAAAYLVRHREQLSGRTYLLDAGRNWHELWVPHNPAAWSKPKLVFPDIARQPHFSFDRTGAIVSGHCYWIGLAGHQNEALLYLLQGLANSRLMSRYHDLAFNNKLYSGRRRYLTQYVAKYPVPDLDSTASQRIVAIVRALVQRPAAPLPELRADLEQAVAAAFGVAPVL